jgi:tetratricopeptide (TPR) repeat protein
MFSLSTDAFSQNWGDLDQAFFYFSEHPHHRNENLLSLQRQGKQATMLDEIRLANAYNNVAGILCAQGWYQEAELNNTLSLKIKECWTAECDLRYLLSLSFSNLANVFDRQEKWDQAAQYYEKAIEIGKESNDTTRRALTYHSFGCMRLEQRQVIAARDLSTEAFQLRSEALGDDNDTATTLHMLALCHYRLGDIINARCVLCVYRCPVCSSYNQSLTFGRDLLLEAVRILEKTPQEQNRRRIARSKYKLSHVLRELHDPRSKDFLFDARRLRTEVMSADEVRGEENEATFDALVAYI